MARWPAARWDGLTKNFGGTLRPQSVCLHHQAGNGNPKPVYLARGVSAHFWIPRTGQPVQHVDTGRVAWHGVAHNAYSIGVETEGCATAPYAQPLNENQLRWFGDLMKWANKTHGIPLQLSEAVTTPGLNYHRCRGGPATGCPCQARVNQRGEILRRARGGAPAPGGPKAPTFPGRLLRQPPVMRGEDVRQWQARMAQRDLGRGLAADGAYGPRSEAVCRSFQRYWKLAVDGIVGPVTWKATWEKSGKP